MKVTVQKGETLARALEKLHIGVALPCGGNGTCGQCKAYVEGFGEIKTCQFKLPGDYEVRVRPQMTFDAVSSEEEILNHIRPVTPRERWDEVPVMMVDIGTTTIVCKAFFQGVEVTASGMNPQRRFGADVMSRIKAAGEGRLPELQQDVRAFLLEAKERLEEQIQEKTGQRHRQQMETILVAANTTMTHLMWGWSCEGLGKAPFHPVSLAAKTDVVAELSGASLSTLPAISAYVGGDIVSGIWRLGMSQTGRVELLIDLGTNGEMALANGGELFVASTAAGPAFEGSLPAQKIYAAGVFRCLAYMVEHGIMDERGLLCEEYHEEGYPVSESGMFGEDVRITQDDIRDFQMAKSAIRSGIESLLQAGGIEATDVEQVYLAGGMGYYIHQEDAIALGLLPPEFASKVTAVGNLSLAGAVGIQKVGFSNVLRELNEICGKAQEIILADDELFHENYVKYMDF